MTSFDIEGISVTFPFEPYEIQKNYMRKVIQSLQNGENAILESPTGTGKTLCLLCASLAWLTAKKAEIQSRECVTPDVTCNVPSTVTEDVDLDATIVINPISHPQIIYSSRTHSQLFQAMQELKRTSYNHFQAVAIGSRNRLCIHPDLANESNAVMSHMCGAKRVSQTCEFFNGNKRINLAQYNEQILDIEDLVKFGKADTFCPYYASRDAVLDADIVFMPYNYLLDPMVQKTMSIELENAIVIMDEAHNIEKTCEESASVELQLFDLDLCADELMTTIRKFRRNRITCEITLEEFYMIKDVVANLYTVIDKLTVTTKFDGDHIFTILNDAGVTFNNYSEIRSTINKIIKFSVAADLRHLRRTIITFEMIVCLLAIVFSDQTPEFRNKIKKCFKIYISEEEIMREGYRRQLIPVKTKVFDYWCLSPAFGMNMFMKTNIRCLILTSGTLAPLQPLLSELELNVSITLENPHIVKGDQFCIGILREGPDGVELNSSYKNRNQPEYLSSLGRTILNITRMVPDGLLIFFPSYSVMANCRKYWEGEGLWNDLNNQKAIYVEPKFQSEFDSEMVGFHNHIRDPQYKGAIFMGVCRGKIAEGLDFADTNGRAVIIVGLPYPAFHDPRVTLKQAYLNEQNNNSRELLSGTEWYTLEAVRAVNQAIGRIIRHKDDYGAIILLDSRFTESRIQSQLSLWLRNHIKVICNFGEIIKGLKNFYRNAKTNLPPPQEKPNIYASTRFSTTENRKSVSWSRSKRKRRNRLSARTRSNQHTHTAIDRSKESFAHMVQNCIKPPDFEALVIALEQYRDEPDIDDFTNKLDATLLHKYNFKHIARGLFPYIKDSHKQKFGIYCAKL